MPMNVYEDVTYISGHEPSALVKSEATHQHPSHRVLVSPVVCPEVAAGWGDFDRPDLLRSNGVKESEGYLTLALCVAMRVKTKHGPGDKRKAVMGYNVADILFLQPIEEAAGRFRRVGVGNIFDPDILQCFENSGSH